VTIELLKGKHLGSNFEFFDQMRHRLQTSAQITIAYHIRRFLKKIHDERAQAYKRSLTMKKNKRKVGGVLGIQSSFRKQTTQHS